MYGNSFYEMAIKSKPMTDYYLKVALGFMVILAGILLFPFISGISFLIVVVGVWILYAFGKDCRVEYEYTFTDNEVEIAAVLNAMKRKELFSFGMDKVTMIVPKNSQRIENEQIKKIRDYSSKREDAEVICMVLDTGNGKQMVILEPDERALAHIKTYAKNKMHDL